MQTLKFIGRGSAFNIKEGNTAAYYKSNDYMLLIDCGSNIFERILNNNLLDDIKEIYIFVGLTSEIMKQQCRSLNKMKTAKTTYIQMK